MKRTGDLQLNDLQEVARAHRGLTTAEVSQMLDRIREAQDFAGHILASG